MRLPQKASRALLMAATTILVAVVAAPSVGAAGDDSSGQRSPIGPVQRLVQGTVYNTHWSGYAAAGNKGAFTSVGSTWTQPAATCSPGETSYASFWVGLDGYNSNTVEQTGTDSDCSNGKPAYYAWYEMYPKLSAKLPVNVNPGDTITANVTAGTNGAFTLTLTDSSNSQSKTVTANLRKAALSSAEVITEAPSSNHGPFGTLGLADFGTVTFNGPMANGSALASSNPDEIVMTTTGTSSGTVKAQPSKLSSKSFSVTWEHS